MFGAASVASGFHQEGSMTTTRRSTLAALVVAVLMTAACAMRSPNIADIKYNPGRYYNRTVAVEGVVSSSWGIPLLPFKVYKIEDGTGEVTVVSQSMRVPPRGARVRVRGRVEEFGTFGGRSIGMHIREDHLRVVNRY
jgi:hypothetical protein